MISNELKWKIVANGSALLAAVAIRAVVSQSWKAIKHEDPPVNPESPEVKFREAVIWTIATAITAGLARLLAHKGAALGWKKVTGVMPPM